MVRTGHGNCHQGFSVEKCREILVEIKIDKLIHKSTVKYVLDIVQNGVTGQTTIGVLCPGQKIKGVINVDLSY